MYYVGYKCESRLNEIYIPLTSNILTTWNTIAKAHKKWNLQAITDLKNNETWFILRTFWKQTLHTYCVPNKYFLKIYHLLLEVKKWKRRSCKLLIHYPGLNLKWKFIINMTVIIFFEFWKRFPSVEASLLKKTDPFLLKY